MCSIGTLVFFKEIEKKNIVFSFLDDQLYIIDNDAFSILEKTAAGNLVHGSEFCLWDGLSTEINESAKASIRFFIQKGILECDAENL